MWPPSTFAKAHTVHLIERPKKSRPVDPLQPVLPTRTVDFDCAPVRIYCVLALIEGAGIWPTSSFCSSNTMNSSGRPKKIRSVGLL